MALQLLGAYARAPWRIRALFNQGGLSGQLPAAFTLSQLSGGAVTIRVVSLFAADVSQLELVISEPLVPGSGYLLNWSGTSVPFRFDVPVTDAVAAVESDRPDDELFGVDLDWLFSTPTADGDCPRRRGLDCLLHDLPARARLRTGELVHAVTAGGNLPNQVNGPEAESELKQVAASLEGEFRDDDRVADVRVDVSTDVTDEGAVKYTTRVVPVATGKPLSIPNA
jgi:hypothetical protein